MNALDSHQLRDRLEAACRRFHGAAARIDDLTRLTAGASAATWKFDLALNGEARPMIVQLFTGENQFAVALDKRTQGLVQQCAFEANVPTPRVDGILADSDGMGEGFITEFIAGETLGHRITRDPGLENARVLMTAQCAEILAGIHRVNAESLPDLPGQSPGHMIEALFDTHESYGQRIPVFELAFQWLTYHAPDQQCRQLVHGDFRNGNFIVDDTGIVTVLDWEAAHLGDPHEDLGWLCMNAWRFGRINKPVGGFGDRRELYTAYERASQTAVDPDRVRFWEVYGTLKWGVICQWFAHQFVSSSKNAFPEERPKGNNYLQQ